LFFVLVAFPPARIDPAPLIAIPVDLAAPSEVTKIKAGSKDAKDDAVLAGKPKEKKPEAVKEVKAEPEAELPPSPKAETPKETPQQAAKKPDPLPFLHTADFFGVGPEELLVLGDSGNDAQAARAAGCPVLIVPYGYNEGTPVQNLDADGIVDSLLAVADRLQPVPADR
jgi:hypothetical protein